MVPVLTSRRASELPISEATCVLKVRTRATQITSEVRCKAPLLLTLSGGANGCTANTGCPNIYRNSNCSVRNCDANSYNVNGSDAYSSSTSAIAYDASSCCPIGCNDSDCKNSEFLSSALLGAPPPSSSVDPQTQPVCVCVCMCRPTCSLD